MSVVHLIEDPLSAEVWTCPPNHIPDQFQAIGVEIPADGENETMTPSMAEAERTGDDLIKDANLDSKKYDAGLQIRGQNGTTMKK